MTAPQTPTFIDPGGFGGLSPAVRELEGRVVFIQPTRIEYQVPGRGAASKPQDRVTCDITVVDGGPLIFGAKMQPVPTPATHQTQVPCTFTGVFISNTNMVAALTPALPAPGQGPKLVLGVIERGITNTAGNNPPWNLRQLDPADPRRGLASAVLSSIIQRTFQNPEPVELAPTGPAAAAQAIDPGYAAYLAAQAQAAPVYTPPPAPAVPTPGSYEAWAAAQAAPTIPPAPPGWPAEAWAGLTAEQRNGIMAATPGAPPL